MKFTTLILTFLVFYLVLTYRPSYAEGDTQQERINKSLDTLKSRSQDWLGATVSTLRALYDSVTQMGRKMTQPKTSNFVAGCGCGV